MTPTERAQVQRRRRRAARRQRQPFDLRLALEAGLGMTYDGRSWQLVPVVDLDAAVDADDAAERAA